jgi:D-tyrosyl-tRNA(Tyr) deacylase
VRALIRRVLRADVLVSGNQVGAIHKGLLIYLGIAKEDDITDLEWLIKKVLDLRIFEDETGKMSSAVSPESGILVVSQFTLLGNVFKGSRPSFHRAAVPAEGLQMYQAFVKELRKKFVGKVEEGVFGAEMKVNALDDGPVTIWIDSRHRKY